MAQMFVLQDDKATSAAKLSYAQMVQKPKEETPDKGEGADKSDSETDTPLQQSNKPNQSLKEQGQPNTSQKNTSAVTKVPAKDSFRKDRENDDRDDFRKYRDGEPKEQRFNSGRRLKENRERPIPSGDKFDRERPRRDFRERDGPVRERDAPIRERDGPIRERDGQRQSVGK